MANRVVVYVICTVQSYIAFESNARSILGYLSRYRRAEAAIEAQKALILHHVNGHANHAFFDLLLGL